MRSRLGSSGTRPVVSALLFCLRLSGVSGVSEAIFARRGADLSGANWSKSGSRRAITMYQPARPVEVLSWSGVGVGRRRTAAAARKNAARRGAGRSVGAGKLPDQEFEF